MDGVSKLVGHGSHVIGAALVIKFHPGSHAGDHARTEGAALFTLAHFTIQVILIENALRQLDRQGQDTAAAQGAPEPG